MIFGATEEQVLDRLEAGGYFDKPVVKGYLNTRFISYATAGTGLIGTALAFVQPNFFPYATYASALGAVCVLV